MEIDRVVGNERLPTLDDRINLPYIQAIVAEVARIRPPVSLCESCDSFDAIAIL